MKILLICSAICSILWLGCNDYEHEKNPVEFAVYPVDSLHWFPGDSLWLDTFIIADSGIIVYSPDTLK